MNLNRWMAASFGIFALSLAVAAAITHANGDASQKFPKNLIQFKEGTHAKRVPAHWTSSWAEKEVESIEVHGTSVDCTFGESTTSQVQVEFNGFYAEAQDPVAVELKDKKLVLRVKDHRSLVHDGDHAVVTSWRDHIHLDLDFDEIKPQALKILLPKAARLPINFETVSGDIAGTLNTKALGIKSVSGDISVDGTIENFKMSTVSGDAHLKLSAVPAVVEFKSVSGDITLKTPKPSSVTATYSTISGSVSAPEGLNPGELSVGGTRTMTVGAGASKLEFKTTSGDVSIE